ncbi:probable glutamate receptor [Nymphalis io]|uniref:probable glutamate receptor n=1 Tax=Inachis io TaxID=171585 RepID=UPI0021681048|nr:probable glutamate receptor [Nymphalis io]
MSWHKWNSFSFKYTGESKATNTCRYCDFSKHSPNEFYKQIHNNTQPEFNMNEAHFDWLIIAKSIEDFKTLSESLNATNVRFDQNIVVTFPGHGFRVIKTELFLTSYKEIQNQMNLHNANLNIYVIQVFKMRLNSTLFVAMLGEWNQDQSMSSLSAPYPVEARNLMGEVLIVGRCNSSIDGTTLPDEETSSTPDLLDNVLDFLTKRLNATSLSRYYGKLGYRTYEGAWTGLLGALMEHSVDIALEPVTAVTSRQSDMDFIFPITRTMCNIYIRHQETSAVRDIFLAPFSPQLIACVVCVAFLASITMIIISKTCLKARCMSFTDVIIWSMGIICQQGSSWRPCNAAASVVLIVSLLFALVIYNAYAAFITSVLSVRVANVGSLADVLQSSNIKIGYVRNGADQMYLMSTKDVQLNAFYIRGYSEAENLVSSTEEGLVRAAIQDYAFFSGQRAARTTIRSLSQARGRCALRELPVLSTRAQVAFPLPSGSPYARPVLISLLQLRSGGILARLEAALEPSMPKCEPSSGFASARAADVKTALLVILTGYVAAILIGAAEYSWKNRMELKRHLKKRWRRVFC